MLLLLLKLEVKPLSLLSIGIWLRIRILPVSSLFAIVGTVQRHKCQQWSALGLGVQQLAGRGGQLGFGGFLYITDVSTIRGQGLGFRSVLFSRPRLAYSEEARSQQFLSGPRKPGHAL